MKGENSNLILLCSGADWDCFLTMQHLVKKISRVEDVITYWQGLHMVLVGVIRQPRMKKYAISSASCRVPVFGGGQRSSGEVALPVPVVDTVGWRLAGLADLGGEGTNSGAGHPSDDSCLLTLSKSNSSPESELECECCVACRRGRCGPFPRVCPGLPRAINDKQVKFEGDELR